MESEVPRISGKDTRLRRLALAQVRDLRAAGLSYREIGLRFHAGGGHEPVHPAGAAKRPVPSPSSVGPAMTGDHRHFLRALDAVPVALFFIGPSRRVIHATEPAIRMLATDAGEEQIRHALDAFVCRLSTSAQRPPLSNSGRGVQEIAAREIRTAAGRYRLRGSSLALDLWGIGSTLLVCLETAPPEPITPEALRARFGLTQREAEVALLLAQRRSTPEIAGELQKSPHTIRQHVRRVLAKLGVHSRRAVAAALEAGRKGAGGEK